MPAEERCDALLHHRHSNRHRRLRRHHRPLRHRREEVVVEVARVEVAVVREEVQGEVVKRLEQRMKKVQRMKQQV